MRKLPPVCRHAQDRLSATRIGSGDELDSSTEEHFERCSVCAEFASRLEDVAAVLTESPRPVVPSPDFSSRVLSELPGPAESLGWAALRLLPAAVALVLALSWLSVVAVDSHELLFDPLDASVLMTYPIEDAP